MQEIETTTNVRTDRDVQVIPLEPALRMRYWLSISGIIVLLLYIIDVYFTSSAGSQENSCLHIAGFYYVIFAAAALFSLSQWKALEKRRQQAARYLLITGGASRSSADRPLEDVPALPDTFTMRARRRWSGTWALAVFYALLLSIPAMVVYAYLQGSPRTIQQGLPAAFVLLQNGLNIGLWLLLTLLAVGRLIFAPCQELIATREGLTCRRGYRVSSIPWSQARLFAVIGQPGSEHAPAFYELASQKTLIRWPAHLSGQPLYGRPIGVVSFASGLARPEQPRAEFPQQVQFLNIIIAERTGLPLYDLR